MTILDQRTAAGERILLAHADALAVHVDRAIAGIWSDLRDVLSTTRGYADDYRRALAVLRQLPGVTTGTLAKGLHGLYLAGHTLTAKAVVGSLKTDGLKRLAFSKRLGLLEDDQSQVETDAATILAAFQRLDTRRDNFLSLVLLRPAAGLSRERFDAAVYWLRVKGFMSLSAAEGRHGITPEQNAAAILEPGRHGPDMPTRLLFASVSPGFSFARISPPPAPPPTITAALPPDEGGLYLPDFRAAPKDRDGWEQYVKDMIFPPPAEETIWRALGPLVQPKDWVAVGNDQRKLPHELADVLATGAAQGRSQRSIANDLKPYLEGSRVRAARLARTFGLHIAHTAQQEAYDALGDHCIGFTIHARVDEHSRPWHAARDKQRYYKVPGPGQKGMESCPAPPFEPEDMDGVPAGHGRLAFNCRCNRCAILAGLEMMRAA